VDPATDLAHKELTAAKIAEFVPASFAERGAVVPFTTPLLNQARMRKDRAKRVEFLLPNFSAGKGIYVVPWKSLPSLMTVTLHDRLLYEGLEGVDELTPEAVRRAALEVAAGGVAGPQAATAAKATRARDAQYLTLTNFSLVVELLKLVGIGAEDLLRPGLSVEESRTLARASLDRVAQIVKIPPDELSAKVEMLSETIAPVGLPGVSQPGRLRQLRTRLEVMRHSLEAWAEADSSDLAQLGTFCAQIIKHTQELLDIRLGRFDDACRDLRKMVQDDMGAKRAILEHLSGISWLLDGWDFLTVMWAAVADKPHETQQTTMSEMFRYVPLIPRQEAIAADNFDFEGLARIQRRWMLVNEDWRTGTLDMPAVMRIEALKAEMA
jgi:hypothetical protein